VFNFHREWLASTLTFTAGSPLLVAVGLSASSIPSVFANFLNSWDLIQFTDVDVTIEPLFDVNTSAGQLPAIAWTPNYDDTGAPASYDAVAGIGSSKQRTFNRAITQRCLCNTVFSASGATNLVVLQQPWINAGVWTSSSNTMPLMKFAVQAMPTVLGQLNVRFKVKFRAVQPIMG
jgi:hypothetical protein